FRGMALPAWASRTGFRLLDPVKTLRGQAQFILHLHDREALLRRERQRRFLEGEGWVAWPGPAMADFLRQFIAHNRMLEGGFVIEDRLVTLADIRRPILAVVGVVDQIAPAAGVGAGMARSVAGTAARAARGAREVAREAAGQLPRLVRLEQMQPSTRVSLGLLVEERRRRTPDEVLFLFEDRAYTAKDVGDR